MFSNVAVDFAVLNVLIKIKKLLKNIILIKKFKCITFVETELGIAIISMFSFVLF